MNKIKKAIIIVFVALGLSSCEVLTQIANSAAEMYNFTNCTFDFKDVNKIQMLGFDLSRGMDKSDLNVSQLLQLTNALLNKSLPVSFNVNLDVANPNSIAASMAKMDYIVSLNGKEVISTTMNQSVSVPGNSNSVVTIPITTDLFKLFNEETGDAIVNLAFKLAGAQSDPVNVGIKVKPYISINGRQMAYPNYITLNKELR